MSEREPERWFADAALDAGRWKELVEALLGRVATARERGRFPQSLLLVGPEGLGRELAAVELAAALVCPEDRGPWCDCRSCRRVRAGTHPDVVAVLPQGAGRQIKIDQVREIVEAAPGRPYESRLRVWILAGVEAGGLGREAANAFLKTLEEPPEHVRFLLLAANPTGVLPTIRSRCQTLMLPGTVAAAESLGLDASVPELLALGMEPEPLAEALATSRAALAAARDGRVEELLRLPAALETDLAFPLVTAAALQGVADGEGDDAEEWVRLAGTLVRAEQRCKALNLGRERQLLACLLGWYRELDARR